MYKEKHYMLVRLPNIGRNLFEYNEIAEELLVTQAPSEKKAVNNVIYSHGGDHRNLITKILHEEFSDLTPFVLDLDKIPKPAFQLSLFKTGEGEGDCGERTDKEISEMIIKKLKCRNHYAQKDAMKVAKEYRAYRKTHRLTR